MSKPVKMRPTRGFFKILCKLITKSRLSRYFFSLLAFLIVYSTIFIIIDYYSLIRSAEVENKLTHYRYDSSLKHFIDNAPLIIEPVRPSCQVLNQIPLLVMVNTSPERYAYRNAIRSTWGRYFVTYFVMGVRNRDEPRVDGIPSYGKEAKIFDDIIVFDFIDHYQNLTIKSALIMKWALHKCPHAWFMYKVDDDVLINPWILQKVLEEKATDDAILLGYLHRNVTVHRDPRSKYYLPYWLCSENKIPQYLTGLYIIRVDYLKYILRAAQKIKLHNIEDIFYTYHVAHKELGYPLIHDERLSPYRMQPTWFPFPKCAFWSHASLHPFDAAELMSYWNTILELNELYQRGELDCSFYENYIKPFVFMSL